MSDSRPLFSHHDGLRATAPRINTPSPSLLLATDGHTTLCTVVDTMSGICGRGLGVALACVRATRLAPPNAALT